MKPEGLAPSHTVKHIFSVPDFILIFVLDPKDDKPVGDKPKKKVGRPSLVKKLAARPLVIEQDEPSMELDFDPSIYLAEGVTIKGLYSKLQQGKSYVFYKFWNFSYPH